mmetsp:Transcript_69412/g.186145  ORF Transcript_69412/g.186145 Transcript_69412/m.186145 type:complete len:306 (+) Transcript_69412:409-1326(+)
MRRRLHGPGRRHSAGRDRGRRRAARGTRWGAPPRALQPGQLRQQPVVRGAGGPPVLLEVAGHLCERLVDLCQLPLDLAQLPLSLAGARAQLHLESPHVLVDLVEPLRHALVGLLAAGPGCADLLAGDPQVVLHLHHRALQLRLRLAVGLLQGLELCRPGGQVLLQAENVLHHLLIRLALLRHQAGDLAVRTGQLLLELLQLPPEAVGVRRALAAVLREGGAARGDAVSDVGRLPQRLAQRPRVPGLQLGEPPCKRLHRRVRFAAAGGACGHRCRHARPAGLKEGGRRSGTKRAEGAESGRERRNP